MAYLTINESDLGQLYLKSSSVCKRYEISKSTLYRWIREKKFPKPIRLENSTYRWNLHQLEVWEEGKKKP